MSRYFTDTSWYGWKSRPRLCCVSLYLDLVVSVEFVHLKVTFGICFVFVIRDKMLANQPHCYQSITFPNFERPIGLELEPVKLELKTRQNELFLLDVMLSLLAISILFFARNASLSVYIIITFFATWLPSIFTQKMHSVKWSLRIVAHPKKSEIIIPTFSSFLFLLL